jgi:hypothetical protein
MPLNMFRTEMGKDLNKASRDAIPINLTKARLETPAPVFFLRLIVVMALSGLLLLPGAAAKTALYI